jgi:hypothetical protein
MLNGLPLSSVSGRDQRLTVVSLFVRTDSFTAQLNLVPMSDLGEREIEGAKRSLLSSSLRVLERILGGFRKYPLPSSSSGVGIGSTAVEEMPGRCPWVDGRASEAMEAPWLMAESPDVESD